LHAKYHVYQIWIWIMDLESHEEGVKCRPW